MSYKWLVVVNFTVVLYSVNRVTIQWQIANDVMKSSVCWLSVDACCIRAFSYQNISYYVCVYELFLHKLCGGY